jgi:hypothetical protein
LGAAFSSTLIYSYHGFGYCISAFGPNCDEWGYSSVAEIELVSVGGLRVERDVTIELENYTIADLRKLDGR